MNLFAKLLNIIPEFEPEKRKGRILPNGLLLWFAFLPLVWGLILSFVILSHKTPGFRLEATQHYFVVSKIDTPVNSVFENSFITKISGMEYGQILGALLDLKTDASSPTLTLRENGVERTIHYKTLPISLADYFKGIWLSLLLVLSITFLVVTSLVRSPKEQPADLVLLTLTLFCLLIVNEFPYHFGLLSPKLLSFSFLSVAITHWLAFSAWTHFVLQFPVERQFLTGKPLIIAAIYLLPPGVAIGISWALSTDSNDFWKLLQDYRWWATPLIILGTLAKHIIDYRRLESSLAKSQLKLLMCGGFTGISPFFFLYLLPNLILGQPLITFDVVILFGMLLPLTICLAIVRYNLMDVDRLISKGVTYIILILLFLLGYSGFILFFKHWVWGRGELSQEVSILFILFIALVFNPIKTRLQSIIDRIFLKDPINYGVLLHAFSNKIVRSIKLADLVELLTRKLPEEFRIQKTRLIICHENRIRVYPEDDDFAKIGRAHV